MQKDLIQKYLNGTSISKLLVEYPGYNRRQITKILVDNNIAIRGGRKKKTFNEEQVQEIKTLIESGAFLNELADHFSLDRETMKLRLKELGLSIKNKNRVNRRIKSDYFSTIDSFEKAYWLGFLFTDGSVDHYGATGRIRLQLQARDIEILKQFQEDLGLDCKIIDDIRPNSHCCSVEFTDEQIFNDLGRYGIIPNKTYLTKHIPYEQIPSQYLSAFALGLFDGDGNFYCSKDFSSDVTFGFTAYSEETVKDFKQLINLLLNKNTNNRVYFTSAWHTQWRGRLQVLDILNILYKNCPRFLKRKHELYLALKNSLN